MTVIPLGDNLLLRRCTHDKTASGLVIPDSVTSTLESQLYEVVSKGDATEGTWPVGARVMVSAPGFEKATAFSMDGGDYLLVSAWQICAEVQE